MLTLDDLKASVERHIAVHRSPKLCGYNELQATAADNMARAVANNVLMVAWEEIEHLRNEVAHKRRQVAHLSDEFVEMRDLLAEERRKNK